MITNLKEYLINESHSSYLAWKRKNVTLRGVSGDAGIDGINNGGARFGHGLYTAFLSNKAMAKEYGEVKFVVNAIPKHPKIVNDTNQAEMFLQNIIADYCKKHDKEYDVVFFNKNETISGYMQELGYDGLIIKGREMVNYKPENILYFKNEFQLEDYYERVIEKQ